MSYPKALLVMPTEMQAEFLASISDAQLEGEVVETCQQGRVALSMDPDTELVICNQTLSDGNWYCIHETLVSRDLPANILVVVPAGCDTSVIESHGVFGILRHPIDDSATALISQAARSHSKIAQAG